jgi:hypothetical protein
VVVNGSRLAELVAARYAGDEGENREDRTEADQETTSESAISSRS